MDLVQPPSGRARGLAAVATVVLLALAAAACGSSSTPTAAPGSNDTALGSADTTPDLVKSSAGTPKPGGTLVYGLEAETDGWDPTQSRWATAGTQVALTIFDPLVALDKDLKPKPYLAESLTPNADYTDWDIKLRPNIKFHNGQPLDSAALVKFVTALKASPLIATAAKPIESVKAVDDLTVRLHMTEKWATFPYTLTAQVGMVPAPAQLDDKESGTRKPVGTGPFTFASWTPDNQLKVTKNPSYWRAGLPYLDNITFKPIPDENSRYNSLKSKDILIDVTSSEITAQRMVADAKAGEVQLARSTGDNDATMVLLNTTAAPFDDLRIRQALAYATDRKALVEATNTDPALIADNLYTETSPWHAPNGFPQYDLEKAKALVKAYNAEKGPASFVFGSTTDPDTLKAVQTLAAMWEQAGIEAKIQSTEQATYITNTVIGKFQAQVWRQFGAADPDSNYGWWISDDAVGSVTLNMARYQDPQIDQALRAGRATTDTAARKQAYATVQQRQAIGLPYIWLTHLRWTMAADNSLRNIQGMPLPDGSMSAGLTGGVVSLTATWIEQ